MPYKRKYKTRPRRNFKKKRFGKTTLPKRNNIYNFKREIEQLVDPTLPFPAYTQPFDLVATTDGGICGNMQFRLSDLPDYAEFSGGLFKQYKLNAVKMTIYSSSNNALLSGTVGQSALLCQTAYNQVGQAMASANTREDWNQIQRKRRFSLYKHKELYFTLNQLTHISERLSTTTGYAVNKPKWVSTAEPDIDHFGINLRFDSVDGTPLTTAGAFPKLRIIYTYYLQCKGVK